jgi:hypothetical protein
VGFTYLIAQDDLSTAVQSSVLYLNMIARVTRRIWRVAVDRHVGIVSWHNSAEDYACARACIPARRFPMLAFAIFKSYDD